MKTVEILHIETNKIYSSNSEDIDIPLFQSMNEELLISNGFTYIRNYVVPFDKSIDLLYKVETDYISNFYSDFKQAREAMKKKAIEIGYNNLAIEQIEILSKWFAIPSSISLQHFGINKLSEFSKFFDENSIASRISRKDCVIRFLRNVIPVSQLFPIIVKVQPLIDNYISYGIEGTGVENINGVVDPVGIYDYMNGTSVFINGGFVEENITPQFGFTKQEIKTMVMDVFENGNYI